MVDATMGEGGHSLAFLSRFQDLKIIGIDADKEVHDIARRRLKEFGDRVQFYSGWSHDFFADYPLSLKRPDTVIMDLGISLYHIEKSKRGFSFRYDEPLDMRIDPSSGMSAAGLIARLSEKELADFIYTNGGERYSRRIARAIAEARASAPVKTSLALSEIVSGAVPPAYRHGPVHPATKTFMALRIGVNAELSRLPDLLEAAFRVLEPGGRMGVISFHSAEDKIVKDFFRLKNRDCICPPEAPICRCGGQRRLNFLSRKGISPTEEEIRRNPPSRSARLRVVEIVLDEVGA
jgi:16S rRNA (cytosine1402-N4)-methyltransferase